MKKLEKRHDAFRPLISFYDVRLLNLAMSQEKIARLLNREQARYRLGSIH